MNEGLAEYTGVRLRTTPKAETSDYIARRLDDARNRPSFVRSFAYESGPPYGILLDESGIDWRKGLKPGDDLGPLLQKALPIRLPSDIKEEAEKRSRDHDAFALRASETERENDRKRRIAPYRARLVDGPVLIIPVTERFSYSFNPNEALPLDESGTIYPTTRTTDDWGTLTVSRGALMLRDESKISKVRISVPARMLGHCKAMVGRWNLAMAGYWSPPDAREISC